MSTETRLLLRHSVDDMRKAADRIAELEANEAAYERIIGQRTYQEVADELIALRQENETLKAGLATIADRYEDQAKFADHDYAAYFRDFAHSARSLLSGRDNG